MPRFGPLVTAEQFARLPDDDYHYELVRGRVVRMSPPGSRHGVLATRIAMLLVQHIDAGDVMPGFSCTVRRIFE